MSSASWTGMRGESSDDRDLCASYAFGQHGKAREPEADINSLFSFAFLASSTADHISCTRSSLPFKSALLRRAGLIIDSSAFWADAMWLSRSVAACLV